MTKEPELGISEITPSACPFCGQEFEKGIHITDAIRPGMLAICPNCKEALELGPDLKVRKPSDAALAKMKSKAYRVAREILAGGRPFRFRNPK